jgi:alpha-L-rhamnosidase
LVQDANSLAVLYGVAPAAKASSILKTIDMALNTVNGPLSQPGSSLISPFMTGYDVLAHFEAGDAEGALGLIRAVWSHMLPDTPFYSGCTFEALQPDGTPPNAGASLAHGWGSGPTSALSKYVLGVRPVSPGYKTWLVEPQPGDLTWAKGCVPTPYGPIEVRWEKEGNEFVLRVEVPDGTLGSVGVPVSGSPDSLIVNGQKVKSETTGSETGAGRPGYAYVRDLAPGTYRIVTPMDSK